MARTAPPAAAAVSDDKPRLGDSKEDLEDSVASPAHLHTFKAEVNQDIEPTLHWTTWLVYASCGMLAFGTNYAVSANGFWAGQVIPYLGHPNLLIWYVEGWLVLQVALTPLVGQMSDFGSPTRRVLTVVLCVLGSIGLIVSGSADTIYVAILGSVFFGFSLISYFLQFSIVAEIFPHRMRGITQAGLYAILGLGGGLNNVAGGVVVQRNIGGQGGWRWNLYISAIFQGAGIILLLIFYRPLKRDIAEPSYIQRLKTRIDWVGNALWILGFVPFMMGLIWGGNRYEWKSTPVLVCLVVGFAMILVCLAHQRFIKKDGIYHHGLFRHRNFALVLVGIFIEGVVYIPLNIYTPQQTSMFYEKNEVLLGLHFAVLLMFAAASATLSGWYSKRYRRVKELLVAGYIIITGACIGFALCSKDPKDKALNYAMFALTGFGFGPAQGLLLAVGMLAVAPELSGLSSAHVIGIRSMGGTIAAAIASGIFTAKIKRLPGKIAEYALDAGVAPSGVNAVVGAVASATGPVTVPGVTPEQIAAAVQGKLQAYAESYAFVFWSIVPWTIAGAVALCFLKPVREQMHWGIDRPLETDEALGLTEKVDTQGHPITRPSGEISRA